MLDPRKRALAEVVAPKSMTLLRQHARCCDGYGDASAQTGCLSSKKEFDASTRAFGWHRLSAQPMSSKLVSGSPPGVVHKIDSRPALGYSQSPLASSDREHS